MCFEFASCFGGGRAEDYGRERSNRKEEHDSGSGHGDCSGNHGSVYNGGADHRLVSAYHPQTIDDVAWKVDHAYAGGCGGYAAYVQEKDHETLKLPAWHNKAGDDASYTYAPRFREGAADNREHAAMDCHHYRTTTTTLARY
ncbi:hypothetical protein ZWY2020_031717 [Hordeum vulgare]|nr:hypothetical protein ZWY2020_031717 [Hordeum vulgare]